MEIVLVLLGLIVLELAWQFVFKPDLKRVVKKLKKK